MRQMCLQKTGEVVRGLKVDTRAGPDAEGAGRQGSVASRLWPTVLRERGLCVGGQPSRGLGGPVLELRPPLSVKSC